MLASSFFDIAIGIVFVFLLLSVIASTINEIILSYLNLRGRMLLDGIKTLLNDNSVAANGLVHLLYNHGQIFGLFKGSFNPAVKWWNKLPIFRDKTKVDLPSYIPSGSFASAFLGVLAAKAPDQARTNWDNAKQAAVQSVATAKAANDRANAVLSNAAATQADRDASRQAAAAAQLAADTANVAANIAFFQLLKGVAQTMCAENEKVAKPLLAILETADNDINRLKTGVEGWYNSAMDRVSGWYKYRTQWVLFWIGLVLAVTLNANTIEIVKQISSSDTLRQSIVAAAQKSATPSNTNAAPGSDTAAGANQKAIAGGDNAGGTGHDGEDTTKIHNKYKEVADQISKVQNLGLPLGWSGSSFPRGWWPLYCEKVWSTDCRDKNRQRIQATIEKEALQKPGSVVEGSLVSQDNVNGWSSISGWLLTAVAISLGAPFWFDLLNKFMVVRSTIKPHEKSKEEGSKDKQP